MPASSSTPWQLEGVIKTLLDDGYPAEEIHGCHNRTVVVNSHRGEVLNKHKPVLEKYGLEDLPRAIEIPQLHQDVALEVEG